MLRVKVKCNDTNLGESLRIAGSCQELGNWNPVSGPVLTTNEIDFPVWKGSI